MSPIRSHVECCTELLAERVQAMEADRILLLRS
jgi:hypothetical protein